MVDRDVVGHAQEPRRERHRLFLVAADRGDEAREDLLADVLGLVLVAQDAAGVAVDVVAVLDVQPLDRTAVSLLGASDHAGQLPFRRLVAGSGNVRLDAHHWGHSLPPVSSAPPLPTSLSSVGVRRRFPWSPAWFPASIWAGLGSALAGDLLHLYLSNPKRGH